MYLGALSRGFPWLFRLKVDQVALRSKEILTTTLESNLLFTLPYSIWALTGCPANIVIASRLFNRRDEVKPFDAVYEPFGCLSLVRLRCRDFEYS
jgi:hypothetical protein